MMPNVEGPLETTEPGDDLEAVFRDEARGVFRTLVVYTAARRDIAEEAVAEALARALAHRAAIREPLPWIYRTAFRLANDELRRERRHDPVEHGDVDPPEFANVAAALRKLTPNQRAAVVLRHVLDLDVDEIARRMGTAEATVRVHLHRGRKRLRELLGAEEVERAMAERWERELGRFAEVDLPDRVRARVQEGPRGDGGPPFRRGASGSWPGSSPSRCSQRPRPSRWVRSIVTEQPRWWRLQSPSRSRSRSRLACGTVARFRARQ
jgi:RNA polymerase sigma factor (sigma-70 family)